MTYSIKTFALLAGLACGLLLHAQQPQMEKDYDRLAARFDVRDKTLQRDLKSYLTQYPYTTYEDEIHFMSGVLLAEKGRWKQAAKELEQVTHKALTRPHQDDYLFYRGYTYLMLQEYRRATVYFDQLRKAENPYTVRATYYYAYCQYKQQAYDKALPVLLTIEHLREYQKTVPYYIVQIYYAQGEYTEVETRAADLLASQPDNENAAELQRMLGEIYYRKGAQSRDEQSRRTNLRQAIQHLQAYEQATDTAEVPLVRNDLYLLGMAYYQLADYQNTIAYLRRVRQERDTISESTCMTLGNAYVQTEQLEQAKLSYQAAASFGLTPALQEEAMYNYTLCAYRSSSALGESLQAFTAFLTDYPRSRHQDEIYALLGDAFVRSRNYSAALAALDSIPSPSPKMLETKQYLRYQLGVDAFLQGKMDAARQYMTDVINHHADAPTYTTEAYYWRAEACYRLRDYAACLNDIQRFRAQADAPKSANYRMATYLTGYTYFTLRDYPHAQEAFLQYIDLATDSEPTYADALNRLGDCYFNARDFQRAITYYGQVIDRNATGSDYATFQRGYALGLLHRYADKISTLQTLVSRYPKSDYADDGLYEIARAQLQQEDERAAITTYEQLLKAYPNSNLARRASVERAMLYRNQKMAKEAIAAYRQTIDKYPGSEEAYTALEGLEAIYVETGNIQEYLDYTKQLGRMNMQVTTQEDSLTYTSAELQYMQGNYAKAITALEAYITRYCNGGRYCTTAQYYLADAYYRSGKATEALQAYKALTEIAGNPYMEEACMRVAGLTYDAQDYTTSLDYFYKMLALASTREKIDIARLGILRCCYFLGRPQATIDIAAQILADEPVADDVRTEVLYNRAKAYMSLQYWDNAIADLLPLATEARTATGAEANYLLAECYYELSELDRSEEQIMAFTRMDTQQQYWLARALVLLSDINHRRGDDFQARQYLITLQNNYHGTDDIRTMVDERIAALDEKEKEAIDPTTESEE